MLPIASDFEQSAEFLMDFLQWMAEQGYEVSRGKSPSFDKRVSPPKLIVDYLSLTWDSLDAQGLALAISLMDFLEWIGEQGYEVRRAESPSFDKRVSPPQLIVDYLSLDWDSPNTEALALAMLRAIEKRLGPGLVEG